MIHPKLPHPALVVMTILAIALLTPGLYAQGGRHGVHGGGGVYFDPSTVVTLSGVLGSGFGDWPAWGHGNHTAGGMHYEFIADDGEEYELMLAPQWFLEDQGIFLQAGDQVTVTGSVVAPYGDYAWNGSYVPQGNGPGGGGGPQARDDAYLIVTVLSLDAMTLELRDDEGYPLWRGFSEWCSRAWFDPETITTYEGTLEEMLGFWSTWGHGNHTGSGMHFRFASDGGEIFYAMLAPWWYLEDVGIELQAGLSLRITGSVVEPYWAGYDDHRYLIATEITVDGITVATRDEWGYPLWRGDGWHYYCPAYAEGSVEAIRGRVRRTQVRSYGPNLDPGAEVIFGSSGKRYVVFLAPRWYTEGLGLSLAKGQKIQVRGAVVTDGDRLALVARDVVVDGKRWRLRDAAGNPRWIRGVN